MTSRFAIGSLALALLAGCGSSPSTGKPTEPAVNTVPFMGGVYFVGYWGQEEAALGLHSC